MTAPSTGARARRVIGACAGVSLALALPATSAGGAPRGIPEQLCGPSPPSSAHDDRDEIASYHLAAVDCLSLLGIAEGYGYDEGTVYLPDAEVRRDEMASFVSRTLTSADVDLPAPSGSPFTDVDEANPHATAIARLAEAGVVRGIGDDRYAPGAPVERDQMATFLVRAAALQAGVEEADLQRGDAPFTDVAPGNVHRPDVEGAYELGITVGTGPRRYSPDRPVTREEMASFLARTLDAMTERTTVADRDGGGLPHAVFTWVGEQGRCFQVTSGRTWVAECDPATNEALQLRRITVADGFSVVLGLAGPTVTRVAVEREDGQSVDVELTPVEGGLSAFASPLPVSQMGAVVAYDAGGEVAREGIANAGLPFPANTLPDTGDGSGPQVVLTDVRIGHHETYDRVVFDVDGGGSAGWRARYVDEAVQQGSGNPVDVDGEAILEVSLRNMAYPTGNGPEPFPSQRLDGVDAVTEVYVGSTFEGITQVFVGTRGHSPFRVFAVDDPARVVLDVVSPEVAG